MADTTMLVPSEITHLIVTKSDEGWFAESPQVLGLAFGRRTEAEFRRDYRTVLKEIGVRGDVLGHIQSPGVSPEGLEFLIRWVEGPDLAERLEVSRRLEMLLSTDERHDLLSLQSTPTGEVVFVTALADDRLGLFMDQLYDVHDALVVCAAVADRGLFTMTLASGRQESEGWSTLEEYGWSRETTVSRLLTDEAAGRRAERVLV